MVQISKSLFGAKIVRFDCPRCKERLRAPLSDAGKSDTCPDCSVKFIVPGIDALNHEKRRSIDEAERKAEETDRKRAEKELKRKAIDEERAAKREKQIEAEKTLAIENENKRRQKQQDLEESNSNKPELPPPLPKEREKQSKRLFVLSTLGCLLSLCLISFIYSVSTKSGAGITDVVRSSGLRSKLKKCVTYGTVNADAYYDSVILTDTVVLDLLDGGSSSARRIDPVHLLLEFSNELNLSTIRTIVLARNGEQRFTIAASEIKPLAASYANGGRPWVFNNLPPTTRTMTGTQRYKEWS